ELLTRAWVRTTDTGPCGTSAALRQIPESPSDSVAAPAVTRRSATSQRTVTQGLGVPGGTVKAQPATAKESALVSTAASPLTRVFDGKACTWPPCGHCMVAAAVSV